MKRASETVAEEVGPDNSEPSSSSGVVIPGDVPTRGTVVVDGVDASLGDIGCQDVPSFQAGRGFEFPTGKCEDTRIWQSK